MLFKWEQKQNHQNRWEPVAESDNLWELIDSANHHKTSGIHVSGQYGQSYLQQRVIDKTGKSYSLLLDKKSCLALTGQMLGKAAFRGELE